MDDGLVGLMNSPALLHFSKQGGVFLSPRNQEKTGGFAIQPADKGKKFPGMLFPEPVDQREGAVRPGGANEPSSRFVHDEETGIGADDGGRGIHVVMGSIPVDRW